MFDLSVILLLLCAVPCREVGSVGEKNGSKGRYVRRKNAVVRGRTNRSRYCGISSPFLFISSPVLSKSPLLLCVSSPRFLGASAACVSAPGKERRFEGVGCKLIRTSEEKKRKPRLETGSERGIEGEEIYLRGGNLGYSTYSNSSLSAFLGGGGVGVAVRRVGCPFLS